MIKLFSKHVLSFCSFIKVSSIILIKLYYKATLETIVLMEEEEDTLYIFDIISLNASNVEAVLASIVKETTKKVVFYFTPNFTIKGMTATIMPNDDLFVLTKSHC
ncbi:hypothetical protein ABET51_18940 [Metabacillus fastidiosus]|uniref:hypothetical protein n=1 Tax=Metabacillus fastidiosus TaxID=1458 RepID=UPI002E2520DE|nr:hypothetical protein [Metabacillus fastidiosus]